MNHIVGLSGGKDSTAMALRLKEIYPDRPFKYICTPTGDELSEMLHHWRYLEKLLGAKLIRIRNHHKDGRPMTLNSLIEENQALPNWRHRWCTETLKIKPTLAYLRAHQPATLYVGLRIDEEERKGLYSEETLTVFPMREWGWTLQHVWSYLNARDIKIPIRTDCARCFYQRIAQWKYLWKHYPDLYWDAVKQEKDIGYTFRSPSRDQYPAGLKELAMLFEEGVRIRSRLTERPYASCRVCQL